MKPASRFHNDPLLADMKPEIQREEVIEAISAEAPFMVNGVITEAMTDGPRTPEQFRQAVLDMLVTKDHAEFGRWCDEVIVPYLADVIDQGNL